MEKTPHLQAREGGSQGVGREGLVGAAMHLALQGGKSQNSVSKSDYKLHLIKRRALPCVDYDRVGSHARDPASRMKSKTKSWSEKQAFDAWMCGLQE